MKNFILINYENVAIVKPIILCSEMEAEVGGGRFFFPCVLCLFS